MALRLLHPPLANRPVALTIITRIPRVYLYDFGWLLRRAMDQPHCWPTWKTAALTCVLLGATESEKLVRSERRCDLSID
jgi:hypothetical protein